MTDHLSGKLLYESLVICIAAFKDTTVTVTWGAVEPNRIEHRTHHLTQRQYKRQISMFTAM